MNISIFEYQELQPLAWLGITGRFWTIHIDTLMYTWVGMICLFSLTLLGRWAIKKDGTLWYAAYEKLGTVLVDLNKESFKEFNYPYFVFINSLLFFTLFNCMVGVLPFMDEATKDLNTTFAIALVSFTFVQYSRLKGAGILGYLKEFATPNIFFAPMHIIGEFAKIASMTFRLFGNILGGSLIFIMVVQFVSMYKIYFMPFSIATIILVWGLRRLGIANKFKALKIITTSILTIVFALSFLEIFFGIFEGLIQAFVLTMLTSTYLAMSGHGGDDKHDGNKFHREHA